MSRNVFVERVHGPRLGLDGSAPALPRWREWRPGLWSFAAASLAVSFAAALLAARAWPA